MNPEIPSFKKDAQDKEKGSGLPLFSKTAMGKKPILRVRGLEGAGSLLERLKQFKKKDIAFIAAGLGVLFLAPLAEHFLLGPGDGQKVIRPGFDNKGNMFTDAGGAYEPGAGGMSPGGLLGQGSDVITPLNARDPSALIMGPGATQQPPAAAPAKDSGWNDVVKDAARSAGSRAADSAGPPRPRGTLSGALRGLSALSGASSGGGGTHNLAAPSASNVPNRPGEHSSLSQVSAVPGYKGAGPRSLSQGSGIDALRAAAERQGGMMNRGGSAAGSLDAAAKEAIPGGGHGTSEGGPGGGQGDKSPGGNQNKDNKSLGESLAFIRAKMEMEKALDLKWKKRAWEEFEKGKMMQESIIKSFMENVVGKGVFEPIGGAIKGVFEGLTASGSVHCFCMDDARCKDLPYRITFPDDEAKKKCLSGGFSTSGGKDTAGADLKCQTLYTNRSIYKCTVPGGGENTPGGSGTLTGVSTIGDALQANAALVGKDLQNSKNILHDSIQKITGSINTALPGLAKPLGDMINNAAKVEEGLDRALDSQKILYEVVYKKELNNKFRNSLNSAKGLSGLQGSEDQLRQIKETANKQLDALTTPAGGKVAQAASALGSKLDALTALVKDYSPAKELSLNLAPGQKSMDLQGMPTEGDYLDRAQESQKVKGSLVTAKDFLEAARQSLYRTEADLGKAKALFDLASAKMADENDVAPPQQGLGAQSNAAYEDIARSMRAIIRDANTQVNIGLKGAIEEGGKLYQRSCDLTFGKSGTVQNVYEGMLNAYDNGTQGGRYIPSYFVQLGNVGPVVSLQRAEELEQKAVAVAEGAQQAYINEVVNPLGDHVNAVGGFPETKQVDAGVSQLFGELSRK